MKIEKKNDFNVNVLIHIAARSPGRRRGGPALNLVLIETPGGLVL